MTEKKIAILGSTGSIGTQALAVVDKFPELEVVSITGNQNIALMEEQIRKYRPKIAAVYEEKAAKELKIHVADTDTKVLSGEQGLVEAAVLPEADMVLSSIVGIAGLVPTLAAIRAKKDIALANKETLVAAGEIVMREAALNNVRILPVDSEHCAIFQCLLGNERKKLKKIHLTASGGPFFGQGRKDLVNITKKEALNHPTWSMGAKITIDSATLMNKGLEVIEARWLFDVDIEDINVVIHRESIIHSMVEYIDNSVIAQMSRPSMKHPIAFAFGFPERCETDEDPVSFADIGKLSFYEPDEDVFGCLKLAKYAGKCGGTMPVVLNAANEAAVGAFLCGKIKFLEIEELVGSAMANHKNILSPTIEEILSVNSEVRRLYDSFGS